jgi:amino acid transporter
MINSYSVPPPAQDNPSRKLKRVHAYLLLVLGIALIGAGITVMGLVTTSPATVGVGAGIIAAAGLLSVVFAFVGFSLDQNEDAESSGQSTNFGPPVVNDPYRTDQRPIWPPKTSRRSAT